MRVFAVIIAFVSLLASGVLAVSVVKLRGEVAELRQDIHGLRTQESGSDDRFEATPPADGIRPAQAARPDSPPRLAPAALAPAAETTSTVDRREVQKVVSEELAQERQRREAVRDQRESLWRAKVATDLGLTDADKERFLAVLAQEQNERRRMRDLERTGQRAPNEVRIEMDALRQRTQQSVSAILGPERMQQYEAMRPERPGAFGRGAPPAPPVNP
jgi:hypothetical protein